MTLNLVKNEAPINIICHDGTHHVEQDRPDVFEIDPLMTMQVGNRLSLDEWQTLQQNPDFMRQFRCVFPHMALGDYPLKAHGSGVRHVVGLILLTRYAIVKGYTPFWRTPEAHLHPSAQLGLADLLIHLKKGAR